MSSRSRQSKEVSRRLAGAHGELLELSRRLHCRTASYTRLLDGLAAAVTVIHQPVKLKEAVKVKELKQFVLY